MKKLLNPFMILGRFFKGYDLNDLIVLAGAGLFAWGVWQIYPPAALILTGAGLVWWGMAGSRRTRSKR